MEAAFANTATQMDEACAMRDTNRFWALWCRAYEQALVWAKGAGARVAGRGQPNIKMGLPPWAQAAANPADE
eukprot:10290928-Alexandrium_andersonii.AAC.1